MVKKMENKNIILITLVAIILIILGVIAGMSLTSTQTNNTNDTNDSVNVTLNDTNETNATNDTQTTTTTKNSKKSTKKSSSSNVESESIKENYQAGDGSHYREVKYKDGNIRQYDRNGKLIGSSYESDQAQLKRQAGDSWPGD